jgi:hypothetical protein
MAVSTPANVDEERAQITVDYLLHLVMPHDDRGGPFFRVAIAVINEKDLGLRVNDGLSVLRDVLYPLIACDDYPVLFPTVPYPLWVSHELMLWARPYLIDRMHNETGVAQHPYHPRAVRAIKEYLLVEFRLPSVQSIRSLVGFLELEYRSPQLLRRVPLPQQNGHELARQEPRSLQWQAGWRIFHK